MLNIVHNLANSLLTIIDDILDISKIEANRMVMEEIPFSLRGTVFNALKTLAVKANERFLELVYCVDNVVPDHVVGDSFRLRQVILNLVGNAIKFTENGEVKLTIRPTDQSKCAPNEYRFEFSVSDTGIGIHPDKLDMIFDTFCQADGSTTRKFGGTGLGLSISRRLVNLMGGDVWVKSRPEKGSTFYFTCVVRLATTELNQIMPQLKAYQGHHVLFIDQSKDNAGIPDMLRLLGVVPTVVRTVKESKIKNKGISFDVIIVDSMATAIEIRTEDEFKYIPLVLLCPVIEVSLKSTLDLGISSYMTTPCLPIDLGNGMIPALEGRAAPSISENMRSLNLLLAEDNIVNQKLAVKILEKYHHSVKVVENGLEALNAVKETRFDVILMDVQMPVMVRYHAPFLCGKVTKMGILGWIRGNRQDQRVREGDEAEPHSHRCLNSARYAGRSREVHTSTDGRVPVQTAQAEHPHPSNIESTLIGATPLPFPFKQLRIDLRSSAPLSAETSNGVQIFSPSKPKIEATSTASADPPPSSTGTSPTPTGRQAKAYEGPTARSRTTA